MSSNSQNQQQNQSRHSKQFERLHSILKNVRQSKYVERVNNINHQKSIKCPKNSADYQQDKSIQSRLLITQNQLTKARQNIALLMKKLSQAEDQIQNLKQQLENYQKNENSISQSSKKQQSQAVKLLEKQINRLNQVNKNSQQIIQNKNREIQRLNIQIYNIKLLSQKQNIQIEKISDTNQIYKKQLDDAEKTIHSIYLDQESKGAQLLQIDQKNTTIQRLLSILKTTAQFKQFATFTEQTKGIHFLKNIPKRLKSDSSMLSKNIKLCNCMDLKIEQKLIWTPTQTYRFMLDMKMKYQTLNQECIEQILFGLNKIWLARQENHVKRVRENYENQLQRLKKKGDERFDQLLAKKQIQRLKKQVNKSKYKANNNNNTLKLENLKSIGQYQDELKLKNKQINYLQEHIKFLESESNNYDKVIYMEGALWIISKIIEQIQMNREHFKEFESNFIEKLEGILQEQEINSQKMMKSYKFFFDNLQQLHLSLYEKIITMQQSTKRKLTQKKLKENYNQNNLSQNINVLQKKTKA